MALTAPIVITKHDLPTYVLLSFDAYQKLTGTKPRTVHVSDLSEKDFAAMAKSKVSDQYARLDEEPENECRFQNRKLVL